MAIYFMAGLLLLSFIISILELKSDDNPNNGRKSKKILSFLYFLVLIIGFIVAVFTESDNNNLLQTTLSSASRINNIDSQSNNLIIEVKSIQNRIQIITKALDTLENSSSTLLQANEKLLSQYKNLNNKLSEQISYEKRKLLENRPFLNLNTNDILINKLNDTSFQFKAKILNVGKRVAILKTSTFATLIYNNSNKMVLKSNIETKRMDSTLNPFKENKSIVILVSESLKFNNNSELFPTNIKCYLKIKILYHDFLTEKEYYDTFYVKYTTSNGFAIAKEWEINMIEKDN